MTMTSNIKYTMRSEVFLDLVQVIPQILVFVQKLL